MIATAINYIAAPAIYPLLALGQARQAAATSNLQHSACDSIPGSFTQEKNVVYLQGNWHYKGRNLNKLNFILKSKSDLWLTKIISKTDWKPLGIGARKTG